MAIVRDKEGHYIMIKGAIQQEDITLTNIYVPNTGAPKYIKQILMDIKGETDSNTIIAGDFNTSFTLPGYIFQAENQQGDSSLK